MAHDPGLPPRRKHVQPLVHDAVEVVVVLVGRLPDPFDLFVQRPQAGPGLGPRQRVQPGHQPGNQRFGRLDLAAGVGVGQFERRIRIEFLPPDQRLDRLGRLFQEAPAETAPVLPVLAGLMDQRPEQSQPLCPIAVVRVHRDRDKTRCDALPPEQRGPALARHLPGSAHLVAAAQLVQTDPDRIVFSHDHALPCPGNRTEAPRHTGNFARQAGALKSMRP